MSAEEFSANPQPAIAQPAFRRLLRYARPYLGLLVASALCAGVYAGARTGRALLLKPIIDEFGVPSASAKLNWNDLTGALRGEPAASAAADDGDAATRRLLDSVQRTGPPLLLWLLLTALALPVSHFGQEYLSQYLLGKMLLDLQRDLCRKLLALPLGFHQQTTRGETLSRITNDTARAHAALEPFFVDVVQAIILLIVTIAGLVLLSWQLALAVLAVAPALGFVIAFFGDRIRSSAMRRQESQADLTQRLLQILAGIKIVKAFKAQAGEARAFDGENQRFFRRNIKVMLNRSLSRSATEGFSNVIGVSVLLLGVYALMGGLWGLTLGTLLAFFAVMTSAYRPMRDFSRAWTRIQEAVPSAQRFFALLDEGEEPHDAPGAIALASVERGIRLRNVSFSYGREPVLKDLSLDVTAGEMVAVVGKTGSGKTTLVDLLLRLYDPDAGAIEIDGVDLRKLQRASWLDHVAVVTQDPFLFAGTIRENILYGRPGASEADLFAAARAAHVDEFADRLRDGYETDVGEAGAALSGGQRQRITIARAILKKPDVLIFDEATSALDAESERLVQDAINALLSGRTTFVIAHRLSTVRHADKILVLRDGQIAELGTHDDLMQKAGAYADLMRAQEFVA